MKNISLLLQATGLLLTVGGYKASADFVERAHSDPKRELVGYHVLNEYITPSPTMHPTIAPPTPSPVEEVPEGARTIVEGRGVGSSSSTEAPIAPGAPTKFPTKPPTPFPTPGEPSAAPTSPTASPSMHPSSFPTPVPSSQPIEETDVPTTTEPSSFPIPHLSISDEPSEFPSEVPSLSEEPSETSSPDEGDEEDSSPDDSDEEDAFTGRGRVDDRDSMETSDEPDLMTIFEIICDAENAYLWGTLCVVLKEAKIFEFLGSSEGQYTLFAPTNEAFENSDYALDSLLQNEPAIQSLMSIHMTQRALSYDDLVCNGSVEMLNFHVTYTLCIASKKIQNADGNELKNLPIIDEPVDIIANNGIIHMVHNLMIPLEFSLDIDVFDGLWGNQTAEEIIDDDDDAFFNDSENTTASAVLDEEFTQGNNDKNISASDVLDNEPPESDNDENITTGDILDEYSDQNDSYENMTDSDDLDDEFVQSDIDDQNFDATGVLESLSDLLAKQEEGGLDGNERKCEVCTGVELCAVPRSASLLFPGEGAVPCTEVLKRQNTPTGILLGVSMCNALQQRFDEYCLIGN